MLPSVTASLDTQAQEIVDTVSAMVSRHGITALSGILESARSAARRADINVAVLGRFKAGKSSFLNALIGRSILPVGVTPVTAVVTEITYGPVARACLHRAGGASEEIPLEAIGSFISERENPDNEKQVSHITAELPELRRFEGLRFVDTPGLESSLAHNTEAAMRWLPNIGLALLAVSVDPPLSQSDLDLLQLLRRHTPKVAILLTKCDLLGADERREVVEYIHQQLRKTMSGTQAVYPYSTRPGFESCRQALESGLLDATLDRLEAERHTIVSRKLDTLLTECRDFLALSLRSAESLESERAALEREAVGDQEILDDVRDEIRLVIRNASAGSRAAIASRLEQHQPRIARHLADRFAAEFPRWTRSLRDLLVSFESWLERELRDLLAAVSEADGASLHAPLDHAEKQVFRILQQFRDRLSDRAMLAFGVPLRTTETRIAMTTPSAPDIRIGRIFDRNWELLSPLVPVTVIRGAVRRHFAGMIAYRLEQNLSRLASQWEERVNAALGQLQKEAESRLDQLTATVRRLIAGADRRAIAELRGDIAAVETLLASMGRRSAR